MVSGYATSDFSTSTDKNKTINGENSVYNEFSDSDLSDGSGLGHYTPTWAVHIPNGDVDGRADQVARDHGFINLGKVR